MTGNEEREYAFTAALRRYLVGFALGLLAVGVVAVFGTSVLDRSVHSYVWPALFLAVVLAWTITRNLVLRASLHNGRLRVRTPLARYDIAVADITALDWHVEQGRLGSANPLNSATARIRAGLRTLRVPMPAGAALVRDLEAAWAAAGRTHALQDDEAREFEFAEADLLSKQGAVVGYAMLDDEFLRATTVDGQEHMVRLADIDEVDSSLRKSPEAIVRHPGGNLHIPMPSGAELAHRLAAAAPGR